MNTDTDEPAEIRWPFSPRSKTAIALTVFASVLVLAELALMLLMMQLSTPATALEQPIEALATLSELSRRSAQAAQAQTGWVGEFAYGDPDELRTETERAWTELIEELEAGPATEDDEALADPLDARLARDVALARWDDADAAALVSLAPPARRAALPAILREPPASKSSFALAHATALTRVGLILTGFAVLLAWLVRGRPDILIRSQVALRGFGLGRGLTVFLWAYATLTLLLFVLVLGDVFGSSTLAMASNAVTLLSILPISALVYALLLRPQGLGLRDTWARNTQLGFGTILLVSLALYAIDASFEQLVGTLAEAGGYDMPWHQYIDETLFWGSDPERVLSVLDAVIGAAVVEELVFRGLLFGALRERLSAWPAALISGLIFGFVHGYDPVGLLVVSFSGFVYAMAYERTHSLVPGMIVHAVSNLLVSTGLLAVPAILGS